LAKTSTDALIRRKRRSVAIVTQLNKTELQSPVANIANLGASSYSFRWIVRCPIPDPMFKPT
jgi:hypothetical protein